MQPDFEKSAAAMVAGTNKAIAAAVAPLLARIDALEKRAPERGEKGDKGEPGESIRGECGVGVAGALIDRSGVLILTLSDGTQRDLGVVVGRDGIDADMPSLERRIDAQVADRVAAIPVPKDGKDGFSLDDFNIDKGNDGRTYILKFDGGEVRHEYELTFPVPVYCGIYKAGEEYVPGDLATWGGCLWHCDAPTKEKPDAGPWTLAVKKGRDGKDAK